MQGRRCTRVPCPDKSLPFRWLTCVFVLRFLVFITRKLRAGIHNERRSPGSFSQRHRALKLEVSLLFYCANARPPGVKQISIGFNLRLCDHLLGWAMLWFISFTLTHSFWLKITFTRKQTGGTSTFFCISDLLLYRENIVLFIFPH